MDKKKFRQLLGLIAFGVLLYFFLMNIAKFGGWIRAFLAVFTPIIIGMIIAFILNILLNFFENRVFLKTWDKHPGFAKHKRGFCILITYIVAIAILALLIFFIATQVKKSIEDLIANAPQYIQVGQNFLAGISKKIGLSDDLWNDLSTNWGDVVNYVKNYLTQTLTSISAAFTKILNFTVSIVAGVLQFFVGLLMSIYMLASKEKILRVFKKMVAASFKPKHVAGIEHWSREAYGAYSRFIGGQLTEAFILGSLCFIGMTILALPYAPLVSIIVGLCNLIPMLGAYISAISCGLLILLESPMKALVFIIFVIILQQIENNLIYPKVVGDAVGLDGVFTLFAITIGGGFFGVAGIMLAIPAAAVLYAFVGGLVNRRLEEKGVIIDTVDEMKKKKTVEANNGTRAPGVFDNISRAFRGGGKKKTEANEKKDQGK